jgi:AcrR family transcriptional regulator
MSARALQQTQHRSPHGEKTRQRLLDAAAALMERTNFDDIRIVDLTREAKTATGSFHYYFRDKEQLFAALIEREADYRISMVVQRIQERDWSGVSLEERARIFFTAVLKMHRREQGFVRARALRTFSGRGHWYKGSEGEAFEAPMRLIDEWFSESPEEFAATNRLRAVQIALTFCLAALSELVIFPETRRASLADMRDEELVEHLVQAFVAYLRPPARAIVDG